MLNGTAIAATLFGALVVGCARDPGEPALTGPARSLDAPSSAPAPTGTPPASGAQYSEPMVTDLNQMIQAAMADAALRARLDPLALTLVSAEPVTWPNGALGCPAPGMMYTQALVHGYRIRIQAGAELLDYHAGARGQPILCPPGRATEPVSSAR